MSVNNVILLVNLGSPNSLAKSSIRKFLSTFLADRRVVNLPKIFWYPILYGIILPFRAKKLIKQYSKIWLFDNSPLIHYTKTQADKLSATGHIVRYAFSYAKPSIHDVLTEIHSTLPVDKLTVIPLYPQFSSTTTLPVFDSISAFYSDKYYLPEIKFIHDFADNNFYIDAISSTIRESWQKNGKSQKLVFSYHGLPIDIIKRGDIYYEQCKLTTKLVIDKLGLSNDDYIMVFQSRFGAQKWLTPATNATLADLAKSGIESVDIICPGFVSDCLETLEEIAIVNKEVFLNAGGQRYNYIPCLNDGDDCIQVLNSLC
jgi:ferrochelatase